MDEYQFFPLPYVDSIADQAFFDPWLTYGNYIVPADLPSSSPSPSTTRSQSPSYETPWYVDSINRAIERAAQVATIEVGGYPPYPQFPLPVPPQTTPLPAPTSGLTPTPSSGIQLSTNTLMLLVGGFLLFTLGKRGR